MIKRILILFGLLLILLFLWEHLAGVYSATIRVLFSSPSRVYNYFFENTEQIFTATLYTFGESIVGLLLAILFCFSTMFLCFHFPKTLKFIVPIMIASQVIPVITFAPLLITMFGQGIASKVIMVIIICYFPLFISFLAGYNSIPKNIGELIFLYDARTNFRIFHINIPLSLPSIYSGLKVSSTLSVIGAIVAEFNGADYGLGKNLFLGARNIKPELTISSIAMTSIIGGVMYGTICLLEKRFGKWYLLKGITAVSDYEM